MRWLTNANRQSPWAYAPPPGSVRKGRRGLLFDLVVVCAIASSVLAQDLQPPQAESGPAVATATVIEALGKGSVACGFLFKQLQTDDGPRGYSVYVPPEYSPTTAWPVILFLHGSEQRGDDGLRPTVSGLADAVRRDRRLCPALVVFPQCPEGQLWAGRTLESALKCVEATSREYHLDPSRVYLVGQSLGGAGVIEALSQLPEHFAAGVAVAGFVGRPTLPPEPALVARVAPRLLKTPLWLFHGSGDKNVNPAHSQEIARVINALGGVARYTEFGGAGHNVWEKTYADVRFWQWLLSQRRGGWPESAPATAPSAPP